MVLVEARFWSPESEKTHTLIFMTLSFPLKSHFFPPAAASAADDEEKDHWTILMTRAERQAALMNRGYGAA